MEEKLNGIVLGGVNFGDNDKILNVFTLEQGVVSAKIKGVKKAGAKLKFAAEPFCFAEFIFATKGKFRTVTSASLIDSFYSLREDLFKYYCGATVLEYLKKFCREGIVSREIFLLSVESLKKIAYGDNPQSEICLFLINALKISGYALNLEGCFTCNKEIEGRIFFDYVYGGFFCEHCQTADCREINYSTYLALKKINGGETLSSAECVGALRLLDYYLLNKTEEKLNSLKELISLTQ